MATANQIKKQIETCSKRLNDFVKKVEVFDARVKKYLETYSKKFNLELTEDSYKSLLEIDWESYYKIANAIDYREENQKKVSRETRNLKNLEAELAKMMESAEAKEMSQKALKDALTLALEEFKTQWFERMTNYFESYYTRLRLMLPEAKIKYQKANNIDTKLCRNYGYYEHRLIKSFVTKIREAQKSIINDEANIFGHDEYMARRSEEMKITWEYGIQTLTDKCQKFGVDENKLKVRPGTVSHKGIEIVITDGKDRVIDARVIWAAEYSELVTPHTRYIVTERH